MKNNLNKYIPLLSVICYCQKIINDKLLKFKLIGPFYTTITNKYYAYVK